MDQLIAASLQIVQARSAMGRDDLYAALSITFRLPPGESAVVADSHEANAYDRWLR